MPTQSPDPGRGLLIIGTDTGCGKTTVTAALTRLLRQQGHAVWPIKPVASGAVWNADQWLSEDTRLLAASADLTPAEVTFWSFTEPAAPSVAARQAGVTLQLPTIAERIRQCVRSNVLTLVEGVGGLLCPLTDTETIADLAVLLGLPLLLVARRSLGTLNHTLLTLEAARNRALRVVGVVVAETEPVQGVAQLTCLDELQKRMEVPLLARLPFAAPPGQADLTDCPHVNWWNLAGNWWHANREFSLRTLQ